MSEENMEDLEKKVLFWKVATIIALVALLISILSGGFGMVNKDLVSDEAPPTQVPPTTQIPLANGEPSLDGVKMLGDPNAPVIMVEYSDFECPFCQRHFTQTFDQLKEEYIDTGKVAYVFKHYPLGFHQQAIPAALAAECANEQGKFWEYHDVLYEKGVAGGETAFKTYAKELGLTTSVFNDCLDKKKYQDIVDLEFAEGQTLGIKGTPGFIINGKLVSGARPFEAFAEVIDAELN